MKKLLVTATIIALTSTAALAGGKTYQVTGPVLALTDSAITVQKGSEKWELARDGSTKLPETVKVGSKVTIQYSITAVSVEDKSPAPKAEKPTKVDDKAVAKKH
ncbi:MAG: hypothetical protein ACKVOE_01965 [Rickettsiales bacterium]